MNEIEFYNFAKSIILSDSRINEADLVTLLSPEKRRTKPDSPKEINYWLLSSAQNVQSSPNVIGKAISDIKGEIRLLGELLYGFDPILIKANFGKLTTEEFFKIIDEKFEISKRHKGLVKWKRYTKTIQ